MGVMGSNYGSETRLVMVHPGDIAVAAGEELESSFTGKSHRYVASEEGRIVDFVKVIGRAIGKPELPWVQFSDEDLMKGMIAGGMSEAIAELYLEMGKAIGSGLLYKDFEKHRPDVWGSTKLFDFVPEFVTLYNSSK